MQKRREKDCKSQRDGMVSRKQYFFQIDITVQMHIQTHRDTDSMHQMCRSTSPSKSQQGRGEMALKSLHQPSRYSQFSSVDRSLVYHHHSIADPMLRSHQPTNTGFHGFLSVCLLLREKKDMNQCVWGGGQDLGGVEEGEKYDK